MQAFEQVLLPGLVSLAQVFVQLQVLAVAALQVFALVSVCSVVRVLVLAAPLVGVQVPGLVRVKAQEMVKGLVQIPVYLGHECRLLLNFYQSGILYFYL